MSGQKNLEAPMKTISDATKISQQEHIFLAQSANSLRCSCFCFSDSIFCSWDLSSKLSLSVSASLLLSFSVDEARADNMSSLLNLIFLLQPFKELFIVIPD